MTVRVTIPASTPVNSDIFIAGNLPQLRNWNPAGVMLHKADDSTWIYSGMVAEGTMVEFKITRGSWNSQAIFQEGRIPPNTQLTVRGDTILVLRPLMWSDSMLRSGGGIVGTVRYHRQITSPRLNHPRDVIVWLPHSYETAPGRRYPVLYMHDGQNIIDPTTSFLGYDWRVDEVAASLIQAGKMQEIIIVGIYNSPDRMEEYADSKLGRAYADFVIRELKPFIDQTYRTLSGPHQTATMGASLGGVISFLLAWWHPDVFGSAAGLSNAFSYKDGNVLKEVENSRGKKKPIRVYLDVGGKEETLIAGNEAMVRLLEAKGYRRGQDFEYYFADGAEHNEMAWAARVWRPLLFLFPK